jgi:hypothetical protein
MALNPVIVHAQPEAEAAPAEVAPAESPAEGEAPSEAVPVEAPPAEAAPVEAAPVEATPTAEPTPEPAPAEPAATEPAAAPVEGPKPAEAPAPTGKLKTQRTAGIGVMATGGVVALGGIALTLAFTVIGDKQQSEDVPVVADIEQSDKNARIGGIMLASGVVVLAIGGIVFANAVKKARAGTTLARVRVAPSATGLALRF